MVTNLKELFITGIGPGRQIADKSYYMVELRQRVTDITAEIDKMNQEIEQYQRDTQAAIMLERKYSYEGETSLIL